MHGLGIRIRIGLNPRITQATAWNRVAAIFRLIQIILCYLDCDWSEIDQLFTLISNSIRQFCRIMKVNTNLQLIRLLNCPDHVDNIGSHWVQPALDLLLFNSDNWSDSHRKCSIGINARILYITCSSTYSTLTITYFVSCNGGCAKHYPND